MFKWRTVQSRLRSGVSPLSSSDKYVYTPVPIVNDNETSNRTKNDSNSRCKYQYLNYKCWQYCCAVVIVTLLLSLIGVQWLGDPYLTLTANAYLFVADKTQSKSYQFIDDTQYMNTVDSLTVLIGLGGMRASSTYFIWALMYSNTANLQFIQQLMNDNSQTLAINSPYLLDMAPIINNPSDSAPTIQFVKSNISAEPHYWSMCQMKKTIDLISGFIPKDWKSSEYKSNNHFYLNKVNNDPNAQQCTWNDYILSIFGDDFDTFRQSHNGDVSINKLVSIFHSNHITLTEKTPSYIGEVHSAKLLGYYARKKELKLYLIIRNPIDRLYSHYCRNMFSPQPCDAESVFTQIDKHISFWFEKHKYFKQMFDILNSNVTTAAMNEKAMIAAYCNGFYNKYSIDKFLFRPNKIDRIEAFQLSCYYPKLKIWYNSFQSDGKSIYESGLDRTNPFPLKIIEYSHIQRNISLLLWQMRCWVSNGDDTCDNGRDLSNYVDLSPMIKEYPIGRLYTLPHTLNTKMPMPHDLRERLQRIFRGCNDRLFEFLKSHSELILGGWDMIKDVDWN